MKRLLKLLQVKSGATDIVFSSPSGTSPRKETFPLKLVKSNQVFLAYQVNGEILPEKHGFPLRVVAEGAFGSTWTKYVDSFEVVRK